MYSHVVWWNPHWEFLNCVCVHLRDAGLSMYSDRLLYERQLNCITAHMYDSIYRDGVDMPR